MEAKELVELMNKLIDKKLQKFYKENVRPDIEKLIESKMPKKDDELLSDSIFDLMGETINEELDTDPVETQQVFKKPSAPQKQQKPVNKFKVGNPALDGILNEMASDPSKYRVGSDNDMGAYQSLMASQYSDMSSDAGEDWPELKYNMSPDGIPVPVSAGGATAGRSLESVKREVVAQTGGNVDIANMLVKDYRSILKKADEKAKMNRGGAA